MSWIAAAIVWSFTLASSALVVAGTLVLFRAMVLISNWSGRKQVAERPSWRYWTEPNIFDAERWSVTYWASLTAAFGLLAVARFLLGLEWNDDMRGFGLTPTLATLAGWGWWNAAQAGGPAWGTGRDHA
ncbi:MAG: hypothetical protein JNK12_12215 [Acidimicrobiales bacterium]|nr:hypothetical protein [Acidimicrobiales bacterium]